MIKISTTTKSSSIYKQARRATRHESSRLVFAQPNMRGLRIQDIMRTFACKTLRGSGYVPITVIKPQMLQDQRKVWHRRHRSKSDICAANDFHICVRPDALRRGLDQGDNVVRDRY
jgi:phage portal protein BeeE